MISISNEMLLKVLQSKGMRSVSDLSEETGINRFTLTDILKGKRKVVQKSTFQKLNEWILQQV